MTCLLQTEDDDLFNPDYVEVDRILDVSVVTDPVSNEEVTHYLVKWRGLAYEDSTWELSQDVDKKKVESFYKFRELPSEEERKVSAVQALYRIKEEVASIYCSLVIFDMSKGIFPAFLSALSPFSPRSNTLN